jgi:hypothetical protein
MKNNKTKKKKDIKNEKDILLDYWTMDLKQQLEFLIELQKKEPF